MYIQRAPTSKITKDGSMIEWTTVESTKHWSHTARRLKLFGAPGIAYAPLPFLLLLALLPSNAAPWMLALLSSLVWYVFWLVMFRRGLNMSMLGDLIRCFLQPPDLILTRHDRDTF